MPRRHRPTTPAPRRSAPSSAVRSGAGRPTRTERTAGSRGGGSRQSGRQQPSPQSSAPPTAATGAERPVLRVGFIPGVEPDRFGRRWRSGQHAARLELVPIPLSQQASSLANGDVDMCFVRLPLVAATGEELPDLHLVELWEERPMVVVGTENVLSLHEELTRADLAEDIEIPQADTDDAEDRVEVAASGVGYVLLPMSLARRHHRKDVVQRPLVDAEPTRIALAWPRAADDEARQEFVGAVRGRTARSSR